MEPKLMAIPTTHHTVSEILYIFRENELFVPTILFGFYVKMNPLSEVRFCWVLDLDIFHYKSFVKLDNGDLDKFYFICASCCPRASVKNCERFNLIENIS